MTKPKKRKAEEFWATVAYSDFIGRVIPLNIFETHDEAIKCGQKKHFGIQGKIIKVREVLKRKKRKV